MWCAAACRREILGWQHTCMITVRIIAEMSAGRIPTPEDSGGRAVKQSSSLTCSPPPLPPTCAENPIKSPLQAIIFTTDGASAPQRWVVTHELNSGLGDIGCRWTFHHGSNRKVRIRPYCTAV